MAPSNSGLPLKVSELSDDPTNKVTLYHFVFEDGPPPQEPVPQFPARPRTPLQFGSVPTALPVDPTDFATRSSYRSTSEGSNSSQTDSLISLLSSASFFEGENVPVSSPRPGSKPSSDLKSLNKRHYCLQDGCEYGTQGFATEKELQRHQNSLNHKPSGSYMFNLPQATTKPGRKPSVSNKRRKTTPPPRSQPAELIRRASEPVKVENVRPHSAILSVKAVPQGSQCDCTFCHQPVSTQVEATPGLYYTQNPVQHQDHQMQNYRYVQAPHQYPPASHNNAPSGTSPTHTPYFYQEPHSPASSRPRTQSQSQVQPQPQIYTHQNFHFSSQPRRTNSQPAQSNAPTISPHQTLNFQSQWQMPQSPSYGVYQQQGAHAVAGQYQEWPAYQAGAMSIKGNVPSAHQTQQQAGFGYFAEYQG
jgi:hypothetical protein